MIAVVHDPRYVADIGPHIMPIRKFNLVREGLSHKSTSRGLPVEFFCPEPVTDAELARVHTPAYIQAIATGEPLALAQSQKFPWSRALADSVRWTNGGCILGLRLALERGIAGNLASGFHHAHADHGEGFCTFNGLVVAYEALRAEGKLNRALVLDMDLHYGNGTASLLASRPDFHQLSIYGNWYKENLAYRNVEQERAPDTANCVSIPVANGAGRDEYLGILADSLPQAIDRARPEVILYQAGADPYREDPYSPLDLDHAALKERDRMVFAMAKERGIPVLWVLAGGYTHDITKVVEVHVNTAQAAVEVYEAVQEAGTAGIR